uniref:Uncharacterized protein n=1 Tax=Anguilla anguilla TaxID=7936 RepID=A0A0E9R3K7_ANGAN
MFSPFMRFTPGMCYLAGTQEACMHSSALNQNLI